MGRHPNQRRQVREVPVFAELVVHFKPGPRGRFGKPGRVRVFRQVAYQIGVVGTEAILLVVEVAGDGTRHTFRWGGRRPPRGGAREGRPRGGAGPVSGDDYHAIEDCIVVRVTSKAALVNVAGLPDEHWVPFSLVHVDDLARVEPGAAFDELRVERWFCEREGIE